jgi:hypothetical protein
MKSDGEAVFRFAVLHSSLAIELSASCGPIVSRVRRPFQVGGAEVSDADNAETTQVTLLKVVDLCACKRISFGQVFSSTLQPCRGGQIFQIVKTTENKDHELSDCAYSDKFVVARTHGCK